MTALHFVGFRGDEYHSAVRAFGHPDFFHRYWDERAAREVADGDTVVHAKPQSAQPRAQAFNDSEHF